MNTALAPSAPLEDDPIRSVAPGLVGSESEPSGEASQTSLAASSAAATRAPRKASYPPFAATPTQTAPEGIRFDFNDGCRVQLPPRQSGSWRIRLRDLDTGNIIYSTESKGATIQSSKRWYVRFAIDVWALEEGQPDAPRLVFSHQHDLSGQEVLIQFPVGTLGDTLAWFSYCHRFAERHRAAKMYVAMSSLISPLLAKSYPNLTLLSHEETIERRLAEQVYATYSMGLFFDDTACIRQPVDFRHVGLHRTAAYILGVDPAEEAPRLSLQDESRPIAERYVCIAVQATSAAKTWTSPTGWREVIREIKARGFRVICVDQKPVHGQGLMWTHIPNGAEDMTGLSLGETARWLRHADFFVGLSSGLSWLAWAAGTKVVLISGYSLPSTEFSTPYRVINWHTCNGCWNDPALRFDHRDYLWCPRHKNTPRQFECTRLIAPEQVLQVIRTIPGFVA